jgi:CyaY protein
MTEHEFLGACASVLDEVEDTIDACDIDADMQRGGNLLEIELMNGSKIIVSGNAPVRQVWLAARSGGFHFRYDDGRWVDTRSGEPFFEVLSRCVSQQSGQVVRLAPRR